jgi:phosphoglycolate phosphatase-like HAD superfamily hydrolase
VTLYLFDIDGTLLLSGGAGKRALERVFLEQFGLPNAMEGIRPNGMTDPRIVAAMFAKLGRLPSARETETVLAAYHSILPEEVAASAGFRLMPGAREVVEQLHGRSAPLALATGNTHDGARIKLERGGLWQFFPTGGFGSDSADRAALVGIAIERAARAYGRAFAPAEVLVIGDTPLDVAAAQAVGARVVAIATGGHSTDELDACGADEVYATLHELLPRLPG